MEDAIKSFVQRIEHVDSEIGELRADRKEILGEAKAAGLNVKAIREVVRLRKLQKEERDELRSAADLYLDQLEG